MRRDRPPRTRASFGAAASSGRRSPLLARLGVAAALGVAPFGCLGGQTGQPTAAGTSGGCTSPTVEVPLDEPIRRVVPLDAALTLSGSYTEPLGWYDADGVPLGDMPEEELTLTFSYDGGLAYYNPCGSGGPDVDMLVDVATRDSGIVASSPVRVSFYPAGSGTEPFGPGGVFGAFSFSTGGVTVYGRLVQGQSGTTVTGSITVTELGGALQNGAFPPHPPR